MISLLRNEGNIESGLRGEIKPKKWQKNLPVVEMEYAVCKFCKGCYKRYSLCRHIKKCFANKNTHNAGNNKPLIESLVYSACQKKYGEILNKMRVKEEVFNRMKPDVVTVTAMEDILIASYGDDLLKKNKTKRSLYHISNKIRECGKFLIQMKILGSYSDMLSTMKSEHFDNAIEATKRLSKYDDETRSFGAASFALHFGTTLKQLADLAPKLISRKRIMVLDLEKTLTNLERFRRLVESQWTTELGSLALKDLNEKSAKKPKLLPVTRDVITMKEYTEKIADESFQKLKKTKCLASYRILVETSIVLTILHNRKRVGDIQYLEINFYKDQIDNVKNKISEELLISLSENEKILTKNYQHIIAIGKGSRPVTILIPKNLQEYYSMIYNIRQNTSWFDPANTYFFAYPHSQRWINACTVMKKYAKMSGAKEPGLLTSCRLRKHIATVTQVLNLKDNEIQQLAKFMGHTKKTHEEFYKLVFNVNLNNCI